MFLVARRDGLESWSGHCGVSSWSSPLLCSLWWTVQQSAEQLSHVTERERLAQEVVRESPDPGRDMDHVSDELEIASTTISNVRTRNTVALVPEQPDVSMPDPGHPETPDDTAETERW